MNLKNKKSQYIFFREGGLAPFGKIGKANFSYPRWARESGSAASIEGASPLRRLASPILLSPQDASFIQSSVRAYRAPRIKPLSERSQNPKTWGNWEGIGDFCLQKCQRGRQLSPLSEATRIDRNSLTLASKVLEKGRCPFRRLALPIRLSPNSTRKRREATFAVIKKRQSENKFKNTARGASRAV